MSGQLEMFAMNSWVCDECHDTGRIYVYWGKTAGSARRCPEGCPQVPWNDDDDVRARVIRYKAKPILGAN